MDRSSKGTSRQAAGVEWVALSDGNEYRLYKSHAKVPVEEKLFRIIQVADAATQPAETLGLLSKSQLQDHLIDQYWKTEFVDRKFAKPCAPSLEPSPSSASSTDASRPCRNPMSRPRSSACARPSTFPSLRSRRCAHHPPARYAEMWSTRRALPQTRQLAMAHHGAA